MKLKIIGALALGLAMSTGVVAQDGAHHDRHGPGAGLDLSAEQREQIREIRMEYREQMRALRAEMHERVDSVLTPEQRAQAAEMREARQAHMQERRERMQERRRHRRHHDDG